jgi:hypothetical protein
MHVGASTSVYCSAAVMSVPPPSCRPSRTSTGEPICSLMSASAVSKSTSDVRTAGSSAKMEAITAEKMADSSNDPDGSTQTTMCQGRLWRSAAKYETRSTISRAAS